MPLGFLVRKSPRVPSAAGWAGRAVGTPGLVESLEGRTLFAVVVSGFAVTVTGDENGPTSDSFVVRRAPLINHTQILVNGAIQFSAPSVNVATITVNGGFLTDTLTVSFVNGEPFTDSITFNGGLASDTMRLGASTFSYDATFNGGTEPFGVSDRDAIELTVSGGVDVSVDATGAQSGALLNTSNDVNRVTYTGLSELAVIGGTGSNTFDTTEFSGPTRLEGLGGNDILRTGAGRDVLDGGDGTDQLFGGNGDDTYVFGPAVAAQTDRVEEGTAFGSGIDTLDFSGLAAADPLLASLDSFGTQNVTHTNRVVDLVGTVENLTGGAGNDQIGGNGSINRIVGGPGNDTLSGGPSGGTPGGAANDAIADPDVLEGGDGNDTLLGGNGRDDLFGQAGDDTIDGGPGADDVSGGTGNNRIFATQVDGVADDIDTVFAEGTASPEFFDLALDTSPLSGNLIVASRRLTDGGTALDTHRVSGPFSLHVLAGGGNDEVDLTGLDDVATGSGTVLFGKVADGGDGNDTLLGSDGADDLRGGNGQDNLQGNDGRDTLDGGPDVDTIRGGAGDDILIDTDNVIDDANLEGGEDGILVTGTAGDDVIHLSWQPGPQAVITVNGVVAITQYAEGETIFVYAGAGNDRVSLDDDAGLRWKAVFFGEDGNDWLTGNAKDDTLDGGDGSDLLDGAAGNDVLRGGRGFDVLLGGEGDDDLDGGPGFDLLLQNPIGSIAPPPGIVALLHPESAAVLQEMDDRQRRRGRQPTP
jgi:Ca2+-binding RTX toxin-like protein